MSDTPAERLRTARKKAGYNSAAEAAKARGWKEATYRHHENGTRGFGSDHAKAYARAFHCAAGWLLGITDQPAQDFVEETSLSWEDSFDIEISKDKSFLEDLSQLTSQTLIHHFKPSEFKGIYGSRPSLSREKAGIPTFKAFDIELIKRVADVEVHQVFAVTVDDASMAPSINRSALVLIDTGQREIDRQDAVWLVEYGEQVVLRRVRAMGGDVIELLADNPSIPSLSTKMRDVQVRGRIVWVGQEI